MTDSALPAIGSSGSGPARPRLLFLAHRLPFPPNKGDKIRSYQELLFLSRHFEVDLVCFDDGAGDESHAEALRALCASVHVFRRGRLRQALEAFRGLLRGEALSVSLYRHGGLKACVERLIRRHDPKRLFVFSGQMAWYIKPYLSRTVIDFCDVDSYKWENYAERLPRHKAWFFRREAKKLLRFEIEHCEKARSGIFITPEERALFQRLGGRGALHTLPNGVDSAHFSASFSMAEAALSVEPGRLLFTGAMDYFPNEDAVAWFSGAVFPLVRRRHAHARFIIAGSKPSSRVRSLSRFPGITVTGFVEDMRAELGRAEIVVVPLRIARGMQNKVLEAMASGKAVVATKKALGGIEAADGRELLIRDSAEAFSEALSELLHDRARIAALGRAARDLMVKRYNWEKNLSEGLLPLLRDRA